MLEGVDSELLWGFKSALSFVFDSAADGRGHAIQIDEAALVAASLNEAADSVWS